MKNNIYTLEAEVAVITLALVHEIKHLTMFMRQASRAEYALYDALEEIIRRRTDPLIIQMVDDNHVLDRMSHDLREYGVDVWELCGIKQKSNK